MKRGTAETYRVFVRNWWRWEHRVIGPFTYHQSKFAKVKVSDPGAKKTTIARYCTEEEARSLCERYNETHKPGPLCRKAEYERGQ